MWIYGQTRVRSVREVSSGRRFEEAWRQDNHKTGQRRGLFVEVEMELEVRPLDPSPLIPQVPLTPVIPLDSPSGLNVQQQQNGAAETPRDLSLKSSATPPTTITTTPPPSMLSNSFQPQNFHHPPFPHSFPPSPNSPTHRPKITIDSIDASLASMATRSTSNLSLLSSLNNMTLSPSRTTRIPSLHCPPKSPIRTSTRLVPTTQLVSSTELVSTTRFPILWRSNRSSTNLFNRFHSV
ncbi:hypothetical protein BC829DRAFT_170685 [Chytridium lagenaria]|nr:hypothetical protein BC829DRAFT_170685 [Chytridium lagenaria]